MIFKNNFEKKFDPSPTTRISKPPQVLEIKTPCIIFFIIYFHIVFSLLKNAHFHVILLTFIKNYVFENCFLRKLWMNQ